MSRTQKIWHWIGRYDSQIKIVASLVFAGWIVFQYTSSVANKRVDQSLKYIERSMKKPIFPEKLKLDLYWLKPAGLEVLNLKDICEWRRIAAEKLRSEQHEEALYSMILFYDSIALCARSKLCDPKVLCDFFSDDMDNLISFYKNVLKDEWGMAWGPSFTYNIRRFLCEQCKQCDTLEQCE